LLETLKASLIEQFPIYKDCGGSLNIYLTAVVHIPINQRRNGWVFEILVELLHVQAKFPSDRLHFGIAEILLVSKQFFMDFPELPLFPCRQGGDGCLPCITVHLKGKVFHDKFHIVRVFLQHLPEEGLKPRAVGSLIVIEDDNGDRSVLGAFKRKARHINLINGFKKNDLEGFLRTARNGEHISPR